MRYLFAPLAFLCLFIVSPAYAQGGPDSIYVPGKGYVERYQLSPQTRHFGTYTKAPKRAAKPRRATKVAGVNSTSASCLPSSVKAKLAEVERRFGKVTIISAFRKGARIAGSGSPSYHASCRAVDFKVSGNQSAAAAWLKQTHSGGVGTYSCAMSHIHIDDGRRARWHHCVNKSGRPVRRRS